jgi:mycothiol synthase
MVACKPDFRGRGLGHLLNDLALYTLKTRRMQTAWLTTDDWRLPAIRTYLKAGFRPDLDTEPDFSPRWKAIFEIIGK